MATVTYIHFPFDGQYGCRQFTYSHLEETYISLTHICGHRNWQSDMHI